MLYCETWFGWFPSSGNCDTISSKNEDLPLFCWMFRLGGEFLWKFRLVEYFLGGERRVGLNLGASACRFRPGLFDLPFSLLFSLGLDRGSRFLLPDPSRREDSRDSRFNNPSCGSSFSFLIRGTGTWFNSDASSGSTQLSTTSNVWPEIWSQQKF